MATMNIKVIYHSSTGNTEKLARAIADTLSIQAELLGKDPISFSEPVDLLFIGDGLYFGKANKRTLSLIDRLDPKMIKNAAIFATYGGQAKIGTDIKELVQNKGIRVVDEPFTCKGQSWVFINRNHPNEIDLSKVRKYAKNAVAKVGR
ncbi:nitric oxide synthase [Clostridium estertheticum]|uniref:flavodoxin family protein n=1 Tax=Clostridium estertheticum TaxID=238834 RepID=UPI0013EECD0F|nr:flavodoxin family protein [Clostridium estertheticum]MBZ9607352.1 nitric oxide synthase [Clostridium estertheticum]